MSYSVVGILENIAVVPKFNYIPDPENPERNIKELNKAGKAVVNPKAYLQIKSEVKFPEYNSYKLEITDVGLDSLDQIEKLKPLLGKRILAPVTEGRANGVKWCNLVGFPETF
jgi:hypothetical protein